MSVKVAVRVRPFNQRERDMGARLCVDMQGQTTVITDPKSGAPREFSFDYSFWSHDQFEEDENGYFVPSNPKYADQTFVYQNLGVEVLNNAWEGYNCCLFAYGQTGAGKSYSMVGYGANKGIIPVSSEEVFTRISANTNPNLVYEVTVSMLEIYNERVQDLLIPVHNRPSGGLKIRESKAVGVFVENLSKHAVGSYAEIEHMMEVGNTHRSIGSTQMNATSSRAHTIFTIELKQLEMEGNRKLEKFSVINLVDLAGSEKAGQTGATGDRLKEGCAINKSLVVLGTVIEALADKSTGKKANIIVPYRDSALTRILQNALGGNSKTVMICALSPATVNYEETLSTLRYADRAKKIKNNAVVNESVQDRIIRELREENAQLKKMLEQASMGLGGVNVIQDIQEQMHTNELIFEEQMTTWLDRRNTMQEEEQNQEIDKSVKHITNINEDPQLSFRVYYNFEETPLTVGRKNADPPVNIILSSSSVRPRHCIFDKTEEGQIYIEPVSSECVEFLCVNGERVPERRILHDKDRIIIGTSTVFVYVDQEWPNEELKLNDIDYEYAMDEKVEYAQQEVERQISIGSPRTSIELNKQEDNLVLFDPNTEVRRGLNGKLARNLPLVNEANLLAQDLGRNVKFSMKIVNVLPDVVEKESDLDPDNWEKKNMIEIINHEYGLVWLWDPTFFEDRLFTFREMIEDDDPITMDDDPLWDRPADNLLGKGYYSLKPLGFLFDNPFDVMIIGTTGGDAGQLRVNIVPTNITGEEMDEGPEEPDELIGELINFRVDIKEAWNIPPTFANNVYVEYKFPGLGTRRTNVVSGYSEHPIFNYSELFTNIYVDEELCNFMQTKKIAFSVYGTGMTGRRPSRRNSTAGSSHGQVPEQQGVNPVAVQKELERKMMTQTFTPGAPLENPKKGKEQLQPKPARNGKAGKNGKTGKKDKKDCSIFQRVRLFTQVF